MSDAIRIFIGTEPKTQVAFKVLKSSIERRTKAEVEITPMMGNWHVPRFWEYSTEGFKQGTGFSLRRWLIPEACGWQGLAIYMDADQIVLGDVQELWDAPKHWPAARSGTSVWCTHQPDKFSQRPWPQSSVMLIDCAAAKTSGMGWKREPMLQHLRDHPTQQAYADFMHCGWMNPPPAKIPDCWNHLNVFVPQGRPKHTRLLHYTKEPEQPWYKPDHPLAQLWHLELQEAIKDGNVHIKEFEYALSQWSVKEDWRKTNGLHPSYKRYLPLFR